jgi:putative phosphoesterase
MGRKRLDRPAEAPMTPSRLAILADIHGNLPALRAVMADLESTRPEAVVVAGDLVGRGPEGSGVIAVVADRGWAALRGNHEDYLMAFRNRQVPESWWQDEEWAASRWMAAELGAREQQLIEALPDELRPTSTGDLLIVHGSPRSNREGLGPWTSDTKLERHLQSVDEQILVCGHTHRPMLREVTGGTVVNPGAVGLPFNGDPRAQYAVLEHSEAGWSFDLRQVDYDRQELLAVYETSGFAAHGGVTVELLKLEIQHALPFLVPFQKWAKLIGRRPSTRVLGDFLDFYDPAEPLHDFFLRLESLRS